MYFFSGRGCLRQPGGSPGVQPQPPRQPGPHVLRGERELGGKVDSLSQGGRVLLARSHDISIHMKIHPVQHYVLKLFTQIFRFYPLSNYC